MPAGQAVALLLALEAAAGLLTAERPEELRSKTYMQTIFHPIWSCHYPSERNQVCQIYSAVMQRYPESDCSAACHSQLFQVRPRYPLALNNEEKAAH